MPKLYYRVNLKSPTLSLDEGTYDLDDEDHAHQSSEWDFAPDKVELGFTTDIREIFVEYFVEHFTNYEKFIIMPKQNYQQWQKNREQFQNFDKTAYLSDQPLVSQAFYSAFLETSIFTVFVDDKIVAVYQPELCKRSLAMFDGFIESHRERSGLAKPPTPGYRTSSKCVRGSMYILCCGDSIYVEVSMYNYGRMGGLRPSFCSPFPSLKKKP